MKAEIRNATMNDLHAIQSMNLQLFEMEKEQYDNTYNLDWTFDEKGIDYFTKSIEDNTACALIATVDHNPIGYLVGWMWKRQNPCRSLSKQAELENMFVMEEYRNQQIGAKLVSTFKTWAKNEGVDNIRVSALAKNEKAIKFYRNCGFEDYEHTLEINI